MNGVLVKVALAEVDTVRCLNPVLLCTVVCVSAGIAKHAPADPLDRLPANRWVKLDTRAEPGYRFSQPVYVPGRRQVLHWGGVARSDTPYRNDVRAFDVDKGDWTSDYPIAEKLPSLQNPPYGKGIWYAGAGEMLDCGTPAPSAIAGGVCYDSKRNQVIYTMKGLMAAYDPRATRWRDMKAKTILDGREYPGGPPVYGVSTCYDPLADQIVLFPHWGGDNREKVPVHGRASAHWGTFRYSFVDNTWRRVSDGFGADDIQREREKALASLAEASLAMDRLWRNRRAADPRRGIEFERQATAARDAIRRLESALDGRLRVQPPARTGTPLVFHPGLKAIVMFGGHNGINRTDLGPSTTPGGLNDTWLYDCTTQQWRELETSRRPPPTLWPKMVHHPDSDRMLLVTRTNAWKRDHVVTIWALDAARDAWTRLHEQSWEWETPQAGSVGWAAALFEIALDPKHNLLIMTQVPKRGRDDWVQETFVFKIDMATLTPEPAPKWAPLPPIRPQVIPPDDPQWVVKLKALPANTWVPANPPRVPADRGWGVAAVDPVRSLVCYFGGGHASYQFNDVAVYAVGANRWVHTVGDANDWVPPVGWGGVTMGLHGGPHAHHQRNTYVALDGRVYRSVGTGSRRWSPEAEKKMGPRYAWFWDIDRGGVWRMQKLAKVTLGKGVSGTWGQPHVVDPEGKVYGFGGALEPYDGRFFPDELYFSTFDIYASTLEVKKVDKPRPAPVLEYRPFCYLPDKRQIFFYEYRDGSFGGASSMPNRREGHATWVYDIQSNRFIDLKPSRQPPGQVGTVLYLRGQNAVFAPAGPNRQWVYSFDKNAWAPLAVQGDLSRFDPVYAQTVYVPEYRVLVNLPKTEIMRPDASAADYQ